MVGFKKDNDKKEAKDKRKRELITYLIAFIAGFIIAVFLVLYIVLHIANGMKSNVTPTSESSIEPISSSEVISSSSEESSSSESTSIDPYIEEKDIYNNLLDICKEYDSTVNEIICIGYDTSNMYVSLLSNDQYIHILYGELNNNIEETLEHLISSKTEFVIDGEVENFNYTSSSDIDLTNLDEFKADDRFKEYNYLKKYNYNLDDSLDYRGLIAIGYKENQYISITYLFYDVTSSSLDDTDTYISNEDNIDSQLFSFLDYLYNK